MKVVKHLNQAANGMSAVYKLVFTTMLLWELVRHGLRARREHVDQGDTGRRFGRGR